MRASSVRALAAVTLDGVMRNIEPSTATAEEVVAAINKETSRTMEGMHEDVRAGCVSLMIESSGKASAGKGEG